MLSLLDRVRGLFPVDALISTVEFSPREIARGVVSKASTSSTPLLSIYFSPSNSTIPITSRSFDIGITSELIVGYLLKSTICWRLVSTYLLIICNAIIFFRLLVEQNSESSASIECCCEGFKSCNASNTFLITVEA